MSAKAERPAGRHHSSGDAERSIDGIAIKRVGEVEERGGSCVRVTSGLRSDETPAAADDAVIERISADMHSPVDDVRPLYLAELAVLRCTARLRAFVSIIATKRVKAALRAGRERS